METRKIEVPVIINANSLEPVPTKPKNGKNFSLEECQEIVAFKQHNMVEMVTLVKEGMPTLTMLLNEEGKLFDLPVNETATELWNEYYGRTDYIVGNVLICAPKQFK